MITKLALFNDRNIPMNIRMIGSAYNPEGKDDFIVLQPAEGKIIFLEIPEGSTPWFKLWENNTALFSYISAGIGI